MTYEFFEHRADIGIRGIGKTIGESFGETARGLFHLEIYLNKVKANKKIKIKVSAENYEELLIEFLNGLLAESGIKQMVFSKFIVKIRENKLKAKKQFELNAEAFGEKLNPKKHKINVEVKAATYSELKVYQNKKTGNWISQCVVDV